MTEGAAAYGVCSEQINISQTEIKQHLDQGDIVICSVRQGDFTTGGHFILLYDYDDEGFSINDPFSSTNNSVGFWRRSKMIPSSFA